MTTESSTKPADTAVHSESGCRQNSESETLQVSSGKQADVWKFQPEENDHAESGNHAGRNEILPFAHEVKAVDKEITHPIPKSSNEKPLLSLPSEESGLKAKILQKMMEIGTQLKIPGQWQIDRLTRTQRKQALDNREKHLE